MRSSLVLWVLSLCLFATASARAEPAGDSPLAWSNPIAPKRADPQVFLHTDGFYYLTATVPEYDRIEIRRAKTLAGLSTATPQTVWKRHRDGLMSGFIWAPELHFIDGKPFIYFAAGEAPSMWNIHMFAIECKTADPMSGEWIEHGKITTGWDSFTLDATVFQHRNAWYMVWAQQPKNRGGTDIYISKMDSPTTLTGPIVRLTAPELPWERRGGVEVNEGPAVLVRHGKVFITYSASATDANYCLGMVMADENADLLDIKSWTKSPTPVFVTSRENSQFGPGHNSFTTTPDGKTDILVYHSRSYEKIRGDPLRNQDRATRAQVIHWKPDGTPDFGTPVPDGPYQVDAEASKAPAARPSPAIMPADLSLSNARMAVQPFALSDVALTDSPFKQAMDLNAKYLLSLEPDRLLHNTRQYAGLQPKAEIYGGWESQGIAGHTLGHYLTALAQQYKATGDQQFKQRIDYIISEMAECQNAYGDGYIGALPPKELATLRGFRDGKVELAGAFNFAGGVWVPWYTEHKILAGLIDAWTLAGNDQAKDVALKLADFVDSVTKNLTPDQQQKMLQVEHGGMLESLVQIYELTGDQRYLDASRRFYHKAIFDPLAAGRDELAGRHANTQIPKIIGEARTYEATGDATARKIADFFWDTVVHKRSWVFGGNSDGEHFFPIGKAAEHLGPATGESCNTYNMLKLTEHRFEWNPSVELADYYERALYNQILGSQDPQEGMFTYFVSLKPGHEKTFSRPFDSFWCCVGTGMENHTKYGEAIYFHSNDQLYVNLFIPSVLTWKENGLTLEQSTRFPDENSTEFTVRSAPTTPVKLMLRCPAWSSGPITFQLNGQPLEVKSQPGEYAQITRDWQKGDRLTMTIPMAIHTETLEGNAAKIAILYGPIVLAGDLGEARKTASFPYAVNQGDNFRAPVADVPVLVGAGADLASSIKRVPGDSLLFRTEGIARPDNVTLKPLNRIFYDRYNVYWDVLSQKDWAARETAMKAEADRRRAEEARIVDDFSPGEQQAEVDHKLASDRSRTGDAFDRKWRDATDGGYFEFHMKVLRDTPQILRCTYWGGDAGNREFDILVDGKIVGSQKLENNKPGQFFDVDYPLPAELLAGKDSITVRLQPHAGRIAGGLFGCRVLKADGSAK